MIADTKTVPKVLRFGPFELRPNECRLLCGQREIPLRAKTLAVLRYLTTHAGDLATKDELMAWVWPGTVVSESVLATSISELRRALEDAPRDPRYIQTVHGVGYRFLAPVAVGDSAVFDSASRVADAPATSSTNHAATPTSGHAGIDEVLAQGTTPFVHFCGRVAELGILDQQLELAKRGNCRVVFVAGGPGEGKSALVHSFAERASGSARIAIGQSLPEYDVGEPFLPVIEALARLLRSPGGADLREEVQERSPRWAGIIDNRSPTESVSRDRLLHELVGVLAALSAQRPLVLLLEDLHWADPSTLALLRALSLRSDAMRLLLLGTYRPIDAILSDREIGEIRRDVVLKNRGREIAMTPLNLEDVRAYCERRYQSAAVAAALAEPAWSRSGGVPLFLVALADQLEGEGVLVREDNGWRMTGTPEEVKLAIPSTIREMVDRRVRSLGDFERRIMEAAAVLGTEFAVDFVAGILAEDVETVEDRCLEICRRTRLLATNEETQEADPGRAPRFRFAHAWYPAILYEHLPATRRARLHEAAGRRMADLGGGVDAEVAAHFEQAGLRAESAQWRLHAARRLLRTSPSEEAVAHLQRGLKALDTEGSSGRPGQNDAEALLRLRTELKAHLAFSLMLLRGYTHPQVGEAYDRFRALVRDRGDSRRHLQAITGAALARFAQARLGEALHLMTEAVDMALRLGLPSHSYVALVVFSGETRIYQAAFRDSLEIVAGAERLLESRGEAGPGGDAVFLVDPAPYAMSMRALALQLLGDREAAAQAGADALTSAAKLNHTYTLVSVLGFECVRLGLLGDWEQVREISPRVLALTDAHGLEHWGWVTRVILARALADCEGGRGEALAVLEASLAKRRAMGAKFGRTVLRSWAAGVYAELGDLPSALRWNEEALTSMTTSEEHWGDCLALLTQAELLRRSKADADEVAGWLRRARNTAQEQESGLFRSRAEAELARLA